MTRLHLAGLLILAAFANSPAQSDSLRGWPRSTPEAQGLRPAPLVELRSRAVAGAFGNLDRLVVIRNGHVVLNESIDRDYVALSRGQRSPMGCGADACNGGNALGEYNYFDPATHPWWRGTSAHTLQSVTKSVTATLFGIAIERGQLRDVQRPLLSFFPGYDLRNVDPRLHKATLADLLTMRSGIEWHELDRPLDSTNTTLQLERFPDWIGFTLSQPMDAEPGAKWVYSSGGSALMAEVLRHATGMQADDYARTWLFNPLGIRSVHWKRTPTGQPDTEGGLYLDPLDLAKIGQLYLDDGVWDGKRIMATGWARQATTRIVDHVNPSPTSAGYGYQWWRYDRRDTEVWGGNGFGGQFLIVMPKLRVVAVVNSWNVFGARGAGVLAPLIDALLDASGVP